MKSRLILTGLSMALVGFLGSMAAHGQDVMHGRVSFAAEKALVNGVDDEEWSYATTNSLILPGDTVWADEQGSLELEFSGGTFLRLADGSKADIIQVPPSAMFRAWTGSFYVQRVSRSTGDVLFETPVATIDVFPDSQVRIDVLSDGSTTVSVRWGEAVVQTGDAEPVSLREGQRTYIDPGYLPSQPQFFSRDEQDAFDAWNRERARLLALGSESVPIRSAEYDDLPIGYSDLNSYGEWVYIDKSYYWRPTVVVDYVPYRRGYWSYVPAQGYVWVGYYPFSYVTSHHGHWYYKPRYGWVWSYYRPYSPAYVATLRYGDRYIWAPCDPYGRPVYVYGHRYHSFGGLNFYFAATSFVLAVDLIDHHHHHSFHHVHSFHHHHIHHGHHHRPWNIHSPHSPFVDHPNRIPEESRHVAPRRVTRGPVEVRSVAEPARTRVASLERRVTRDTFDTGSERSTQRIRTASTPAGRRATVRDVRLNEQNAPEIRETIDRTRRNADQTRRLVAREGPMEIREPSRGAGEVRRATPTTIQPDSGRTTAGERRIVSRPETTRPSSANVPTRPTATRQSTPERTRPAPSVTRPTTRPEVTRPVRPSTERTQAVTEKPRPTTVRPDTVRRTRPPASSSVRSTETTPRPSITRPAPRSERSTVRTIRPSERSSTRPSSSRISANVERPTPQATRRSVSAPINRELSAQTPTRVRGTSETRRTVSSAPSSGPSSRVRTMNTPSREQSVSVRSSAPTRVEQSSRTRTVAPSRPNVSRSYPSQTVQSSPRTTVSRPSPTRSIQSAPRSTVSRSAPSRSVQSAPRTSVSRPSPSRSISSSVSRPSTTSRSTRSYSSSPSRSVQAPRASTSSRSISSGRSGVGSSRSYGRSSNSGGSRNVSRGRP